MKRNGKCLVEEEALHQLRLKGEEEEGRDVHLLKRLRRLTHLFPRPQFTTVA